jgi:hypothetical protein
MNERIDELLWQAGGYTKIHNPNDSFLDGRYAITQEQLEKFAELIVRECLSIVDSNNPRPPGTTIMYSLAKDEYFDTGWQVAVETKSNQIKQHFGVEE